MRRIFKDYLFTEMEKNDRIVLITGDLGYGMWDKIRDTFPSRFYNVGSAEQTAIGIGIGMALSGLIPVVYSITPFLIYRPFELIRNYIDHEKIPVKLVGGGRDKDYAHDGFSHWAEDDQEFMERFRNILSFWPDDNDRLQALTKRISDPYPMYLNLKR